MKGNQEVITHLNGVLRHCLSAINQYFLHARIYENWGLEVLNEKDYKASILKMKQADRLIKRILFLEGLPNLQDLGKLLIGEDTKEMLENDLKLETDSRKQLLKAITYMESEKDYVSRELLDDLLEDDEEYIDWLETQLLLIDKIGKKRYQQSQMS